MATRFPGRRLSWLRLGILITVIAVLTAGGITGWRWIQDERAATADPWFAAYVDITATPSYAFEVADDESLSHLVLAFIVAHQGRHCQASWGGYYTPDEALRQLDLDRRLLRMAGEEREAVLSFGGEAGAELATICTSVSDLAGQYRSVIQRYHINTVDFDIEGAALQDPLSRQRRAEAIALLQQERSGSDRPLVVWLTLPAAHTGLTPDAVAVVQEMLDAGVELSGVNLMTMNFGQAASAGSLAELAEQALRQAHHQLGGIFRNAGFGYGDKVLWRHLGATPMIGQNDVRGEALSIEDARTLNAFAQEVGLGRLSMWSANRDQECGSNYPDWRVVSDSCSGVEQGDQRFAAVLGQGLSGLPNLAQPADDPEQSPGPIVDDPATSPYPIWSAEASYPADSRVVWRRNVYVSKWWTEAQQPDDPTLQSWESPWRLIGPVLEGEAPIPDPMLPEDFYPAWQRGTVYHRGDRIMHDGIGYEAKWWTEGDSPDAGLVDPGASPWQRLSNAQVDALLAGEDA